MLNACFADPDDANSPVVEGKVKDRYYVWGRHNNPGYPEHGDDLHDMYRGISELSQHHDLQERIAYAHR